MNRTLSTIAMMLTLTFVSVAFGATGKRVTVHVKGMACPFCVYNIEKRIKTLDAVPENPNWQASVDNGQVSFDWKADAAVDKAAIREQIEKAGFTPGEIEVAGSRDSSGEQSEKGQDEKKQNKQKVVSGTAQLITRNDQTSIQLTTGGESQATRSLAASDRVDRKLSFKALKRYLAQQDGDDQSAAVTVHGVPPQKDSSQLLLYAWAPKQFKTLVGLQIDKLVCQKCAAGVIQQVSKLDNMLHVETDFKKDRARVWTRVAEPETEAIRNAVEKAGFKVTHLHTMTAKEARQAEKE